MKFPFYDAPNTATITCCHILEKPNVDEIKSLAIKHGADMIVKSMELL